MINDTLSNGSSALLGIPPEIDTPSLVIDETRLRANLADMQGFAKANGVDLVPHVKTHRTPQIALMQSEYGARALCIAKLGEAEILRDHGLDRFVVAYPTVGDAKFERAARLLDQGVQLLLCVEDAEVAAALSAVMVRHGLAVDTAIIVDTGYHREGIEPARVADFAAAIAPLPGLRLRGLLTHEGQAYGQPELAGLRQEATSAGEAMVRLAGQIRQRGIEVDLVSVGSTGTARYSAAVPGITQVRPGIYPFNDYGQVLRGIVGLDRCAARVVATVVSASAPGRALVDAGSKSLGQDKLSIHVPGSPDVHGLLCDLPGWELHALSEEHGWLRWAGAGAPTPLKVGHRVQILPNHICSAFHVLGESVVVDDGRVVGTWIATARGASR